MRENEGGRYRLTPAMQAGVVRELWDMERLYDEGHGMRKFKLPHYPPGSLDWNRIVQLRPISDS